MTGGIFSSILLFKVKIGFTVRANDTASMAGSVSELNKKARGSISSLNKVAGNFHVTAGKVLPIMGAHAHMTGFMEKADYNFTHRIEKLSFGDKHAGIIQPLEGDEKITDISRTRDL